LCFLKRNKEISSSAASKFPTHDAVCGLDYLLAACDIIWRDGPISDIKLADNCDFGGNDLYNKSATSGDECAQLCRDEKRCTHFTYSTFYGKTQILGHFYKNILTKSFDDTIWTVLIYIIYVFHIKYKKPCLLFND
jgi:hypothetical protein